MGPHLRDQPHAEVVILQKKRRGLLISHKGNAHDHKDSSTFGCTSFLVYQHIYLKFISSCLIVADTSTSPAAFSTNPLHDILNHLTIISSKSSLVLRNSEHHPTIIL